MNNRSCLENCKQSKVSKLELVYELCISLSNFPSILSKQLSLSFHWQQTSLTLNGLETNVVELLKQGLITSTHFCSSIWGVKCDFAILLSNSVINILRTTFSSFFIKWKPYSLCTPHLVCIKFDNAAGVLVFVKFCTVTFVGAPSIHCTTMWQLHIQMV